MALRNPSSGPPKCCTDVEKGNGTVRRCDGVGCLWNDVRQPRVNFKLGDVKMVFVGGVGAAVFFQATSLNS